MSESFYPISYKVGIVSIITPLWETPHERHLPSLRTSDLLNLFHKPAAIVHNNIHPLARELYTVARDHGAVAYQVRRRKFTEPKLSLFIV